jgi:hypothetical protein
MTDAENERVLKQIETEILKLGGGAKRGLISRQELEDAREIRVSIRPPYFLGSIEMFTLRNLVPADYHLMLVAIPRNQRMQKKQNSGGDSAR